jgi:outer membrane lipase/esterase
MRKFIAAGLLAVASFGVTPVQASSLNFFTSFFVFGDSLSDPGNLFAATDGTVPPPPYYEGQFSNGPVWAKLVADDFAAADLPTENFAYGFAKAVPGPGAPVPAPPVKDLPDQIAEFTQLLGASPGILGTKPLASLLFGPNDIGYGGIPAGQPAAFGEAAASAVASAALTLKGLGINDVLLFTLPPLEKIPFYTLLFPALAPAAQVGTEAFNGKLLELIPGLETAGLNVITLDLYGLFLELLDNPGDFGVINATAPCFVSPAFGGPGFVPPCNLDLAPLLAFWDQSHPSSTIHAQIAARVREQVAPVPLPAAALMLVGGIAGLGLMRRRAA